jgi:predicted PurR-regulated permease PerM
MARERRERGACQVTAQGPSGAARQVVPDWLINAAAIAWRVLAAVALAAVLAYVALVEMFTVTASVLLAVIMAATFAPFVLGLRNRGRSRTAAAGIVTLVAVLLVLGTLALITLALAPYVPEVADRVREGIATIRQELAGASVPQDALEAAQDASAQIEAAIGDAVGVLIGRLAQAATIGLLALFLTFFFLQDGDKAWSWAFQATTGPARERIGSAGHDALERVGGYLRGMGVLASIKAISDFVFLTLLGVPLAAPLAVLVFFGGFIPYVGGFITTTILILVTVSTQGLSAVVLLLIGITIVNVINGNILGPLIYGKTVSIHPALVLVSLPAGAAVAGIIGLFVAVPIVAIVLAVAGAMITILDPGPEYEAPELVPGWLDRLAQWSWRLLLLIVLAAAGIRIVLLIPTVAVAIVLAVVLAATFRPLVLALLRRGWRRATAAAASTGGAFLVVIVIVILTAVSLIQQGAAIASTTASGADLASDATADTLAPLAALLKDVGSGAASAIAGVVAGIASVGVILLLAGLLCFYFLYDGHRFWAMVERRVRSDRLAEVDAAANRAIGVLSGYMVGTGGVSLFGAVTQYIIMVILGLPLALPLAVLAFFGGFIPYIGSLITTGLAFLVAVAVGSPQDIAIMAIYTIVMNIVQGNFVAPLVYSRAVNLHPAVVLMSIPAGNEVAGILGMFLAVPFLGVVAATWRTALRAFATDPDASPATPGPSPVPASASANVKPAGEAQVETG